MVFHFPPISGGGVVVIVELANKFAELGHDITILTPDLEWKGEGLDEVAINKKNGEVVVEIDKIFFCITK